MGYSVLMQDRALQQIPLVPVTNGGGRITIGAASLRTSALTPGQTYQFWSTKVCWVLVGAAAVTAVEAANAYAAGCVDQGSFPISAGVVYELCVTGTNDGYIAVIQDSNYALPAGYFYWGIATGRAIA